MKPLVRPTHAFTLVELLSSIAIIAVMLAVALPFIGNYVNTAKRTADQQTLEVLNDALTRYKTQGGVLNALTQDAPAANILSRLKEELTWNGVAHRVLQTSFTVPARSLTGSGDGKNYHFTSFSSYASSGAPGGGGNGGGSFDTGTLISGEGYMANGSIQDYSNVYVVSSTGWVAFKNPTGQITIGSGASELVELPAKNYYTFWSCAGELDNTPDGSISQFACGYNQLTALDVSKLADLEQLSCDTNQITTLNLANLSSLQSIYVASNQITTLNLSGCTSLSNIGASDNHITSITIPNPAILTSLSVLYNNLTSLDLSGCSALNSFNCENNQITSLDLSDLTSIYAAQCANNQISSVTIGNSVGHLESIGLTNNPPLTEDTDALNAFFTSLPDVSVGYGSFYVNVYIGPDAASATDSIANDKMWMIRRL